MACPITVAKFVGTISLGLLTGVSYSVSNITIPALQALPTASTAATTFTDLQTRTRRRILRYSSIATISLLAAFSLSSPRRRHPYLIWTSLLSLIGGGGLEWWTDRRSLSFTSRTGECCSSVGCWVASHFGCRRDKGGKDKRLDEDTSSNGAGSEIEIVEESDARSAQASKAPTPATTEEADVNGEIVQQDMTRERKIQRARTLILGLGFSMGVVGIWGDGA